MKKLLLYSLFLVVSVSVTAQTKSFKRGVGYGYHSVNDMANASKGISWWYNWAAQPEAAVRTKYPDYNVDFTPMAWNASGISGVKNWVSKDTNVNYILGFNEPNFLHQANMTPKQAAAAWPAFQKIAEDYKLETVSPAVNYCGECVQVSGTAISNPFTYLDYFFEECTDCQVDYIALHWYGGGNSIMSYVNTARKYGKPIWVTEFAAWDNSVTNAAGQRQYLAGTVNFLERDPDVYRYAWFQGRTSGGINTYPYIDLYGADGALTPLGQLYMDIPVYNPDDKFDIPGRIQAEEYYLMSGLFSEITADKDGFLNIGWTDNGDWADYKINVQKPGTYYLYVRVAGATTGTINFMVDSQLKATVNTPYTGGYQTWKTVSATIDLEAGEHLLRMNVKKAGFNINWIEILTNPMSIQDNIISTASIYPNPVTDGLINVELENLKSGGDFKYYIFDAYGKMLISNSVRVNTSDFQINLNPYQNIPSGVYLLSVEGEGCKAKGKIIYIK